MQESSGECCIQCSISHKYWFDRPQRHSVYLSQRLHRGLAGPVLSTALGPPLPLPLSVISPEASAFRSSGELPQKPMKSVLTRRAMRSQVNPSTASQGRPVRTIAPLIASITSSGLGTDETNTPFSPSRMKSGAKPVRVATGRAPHFIASNSGIGPPSKLERLKKTRA